MCLFPVIQSRQTTQILRGFVFTLFVGMSLSACGQNAVDSPQSANAKLTLIGSSPHSTDHFTQGLFFFNDSLYESVGQYGKSALIKYQKDRQQISLRRALDDRYFAEGADVLDNIIYQLTWKAGKALAYKGAMLNPTVGFNYSGDGWGLASDGENLWVSDGTELLKKMNIQGDTLQTLAAKIDGENLDRLNELEWIDGWIMANRWFDNWIYLIDPSSGEVVEKYDLSEYAQPELRKNRNNVLNGIAWDPRNQQLWVTGKNWENFYQFELQLPGKNE